MGYIDGKIPKPAQSSTTTTTTSTPIYSTTPTLNKWTFRDQLARGHITLNCTDIAGLGVITMGTSKEAWDSIQLEWGRSTDMRQSHAQEALNQTEYTEGTDIQEHIKLLRTRKAAIDNLSTSAMSDETWRGVIIRSIPPTPKWLPVIPSLYSMTSSADIVSTLLAHGMILGRGMTITNSPSTVLAAHTNEGCKNPNCKAKNPLTHTTEDCYWPGGGKEGQFPANFGQRTTKANVVASSSESSQQTEHFALSARAPHTPGWSGILINDAIEFNLTTP
jgi:gag-polypeptide of LTR copia-type